MPEISREIIELYHTQLKAQNNKLKYIMDLKHLDIKTIDKYKIGYDPGTDRYTIPVPTAMDEYVNVRKYRNQKAAKMTSYVKESEIHLPPEQRTSYGETKLYPIENLQNKNKKIIFCEGEWDFFILFQHGYNAITKTGGVLVWDEIWNPWFKGKDVIFIYDCQQVSRDAAEKHKDQLMRYANSIKIIDLGLGNEGEDISDWFYKFNQTSKELAALIRKSRVRDIYKMIDLGDSLNAEYYDHKIKFHGVVIGKDTQPFLIPEEVKCRCINGPLEKSTACKKCPLASGPVHRLFNYENNKSILVEMINITNDQMTGLLRKTLSLPKSRECKGTYELEIIKRRNIEEISIIPEIDHERINQEYVIRSCYFFGRDTKLNQGYLLKGTTWADPVNQSGIQLITELKETQNSVTKFELTEEIKKQLKIFQPKNNSILEIKKKLKDIYDDFTFNVTLMYERHPIIMAVDMIYHSVLHFRFLGKMIKKGWLECVIVGDTRCGKSETVEQLTRHFRAGEFITSSEHTSRAGLLGGEQQTKRGTWHVTWGKLVMNNRGELTLDEADELKESGLIGKLSGVRSSGVAELMLIHPQKAMAKTRIIWIINPLYGKRMGEFNYGVEAIKEIFETQQDIARIDFAIAVAGEDVADELINTRHEEEYPHKYTTEICHNGVMFAWSREPQQIKFTQKAEDLILQMAIILGKRYSADIPLIVGADMRNKLARLSVALATRLNSVDKTGEIVKVFDSHVVVAADMLEKNYNNPIMGYLDFSEQKKREREIGDTKPIDELLVDPEVISLLLDHSQFQFRDLKDIFNLEKNTLDALIAHMRKNRIIRKVRTYYVKTPAFIYHLKKKKEEMKASLPPEWYTDPKK